MREILIFLLCYCLLHSERAAALRRSSLRNRLTDVCFTGRAPSLPGMAARPGDRAVPVRISLASPAVPTVLAAQHSPAAMLQDRMKREQTGIGMIVLGGLCLGLGAILYATGMRSANNSTGFASLDGTGTAALGLLIGLGGLALIIVGSIMYGKAHKQQPAGTP